MLLQRRGSNGTGAIPKSIVYNNAATKDYFTQYASEHEAGREVLLTFEDALATSIFCIIDQTQAPTTLLFDAMNAGCIPIFLDNNIVLPFSEKLDWRRYV